MKRLFIILISFSICIFLLNSCRDNNEQKIKELQHQIQVEKQMKDKAQQAKEIVQQHVAQAESNFNLLIGISIALMVLALIIGVAIGSKARKDANKQSIMSEGKSDD